MDRRLYWGSSEAMHAVYAAFATKKAVLAESDTVWGLLTPAITAGAAALDRLKERRDKPYLVLMDSSDKACDYVILSASAECLVEQFWPGPLTVLCHARSGQLHEARSPKGIVGIRVPDHPPLQELAKRYNGLFSTSANISGEPVPNTYYDIPVAIREGVGAIIHNDPAHKPSNLPSTIIDCTGETPKIVREGAISKTIIEQFLQNLGK